MHEWMMERAGPRKSLGQLQTPVAPQLQPKAGVPLLCVGLQECTCKGHRSIRGVYAQEEYMFPLTTCVDMYRVRSGREQARAFL